MSLWAYVLEAVPPPVRVLVFLSCLRVSVGSPLRDCVSGCIPACGSVFAVGMGVCERPLQVLVSEYRCLWILLSASLCFLSMCVLLSVC